MPAIAGAGSNILAFWDYYDTAGTGHGVACRALDPSGNLTSGQLSVAADDADTVTATQLSNQNIAVTWQIYTPSFAIRSVIVKPDCTPLGSVIGVSTTVGTHHRSAPLARRSERPDFVLYTWIQDGDVHVRTGNNGGTLTGNDTTLITHTATMRGRGGAGRADGQRLRRSRRAGRIPTSAAGGAGKIELFQVSTTGQLVGARSSSPTRASRTSPRASSRSASARTRRARRSSRGTSATPPARRCDVFGRLAHADGTMDGDAFMLPTTTDGDQMSPSVVGLPMGFAVAWNDTSHVAPDTQGSAVRARIFYPPSSRYSASSSARWSMPSARIFLYRWLRSSCELAGGVDDVVLVRLERGER